MVEILVVSVAQMESGGRRVTGYHPTRWQKSDSRQELSRTPDPLIKSGRP